MLRRLDLVEQALAELDAVLVDAFRPWQHQIELLQTIPGVAPKVAQVIIAETGGDMSRFPTAAHLAAWDGLAPAMHESAGKQSPAGKRHGNKPMRNLAPLVAMPPKLRHDHHAATVRRSGTLDPCSYTAVWCHSCVGGWVGRCR
jgi:transposase